MIRTFSWLAFIALMGIALLHGNDPTPAQGTKKDDLAKANQLLKKQLKDKEGQIQKLEGQLKKYKQDDVKDNAKIAQLQQRIKQLEADAKSKKPPVKKGEKTPAQLQQSLDKANQAIKDKDQLIATLQQGAPKATADLTKDIEKLRQTVRDLETLKKAPFVHSKILKLKKDDDEQVRQISAEATKTLARINGVRGLWIGKRAEMGTPELAQKGFQLGIIVLLDDAESLQRFLDDPLHKQFTDKLADYWERPIVYDVQRETRE